MPFGSRPQHLPRSGEAATRHAADCSAGCGVGATHRRTGRTLAALLAAGALAAGCSSGAGDGGKTGSSGSPGHSASATSPSSSPSSGGTHGARSRVRVTDTVAKGLKTPWGVAFLPNGDALVGERDSGRIVRIDGKGDKHDAGTVPSVYSQQGGEGGLLGLAVPPDFDTRPQVYAYYTTPHGNRIARFPYRDHRIGKPDVLVRDVPHAVIHNGGRLAFGPDGRLYASTGETGEGKLAQDPDSLGGKILRMTRDGDPAPENPKPNSRVLSYGHRNVEGLAWDAEKRLWATEFGDDKYDELNLIKPGRNYGWPRQEGRGGGHGLVDPVTQWRTDEAGPSGIAIVAGTAYIGALTGERLWQVPLHGQHAGKPKAWLTERYGRIRTVTRVPTHSPWGRAHENRLWVTTSNKDGRGTPHSGDDRILQVTVG